MNEAMDVFGDGRPPGLARGSAASSPGGAVIHRGDALAGLRSMPSGSVQCCITSPPYWGLRAYSTAPQIWGGRAGCEHEWGATMPGISRDNQHVSAVPGARGGGLKASAANHGQSSAGSFCQRCGAWRGELGMEPTPELYVAHLAEVFREVRRVLRPDGTLFLNLGDSYAGSGKGLGSDHGKAVTSDSDVGEKMFVPPGLKPKDLCENPSDVVRALRADGWWLRSRIPWLKRNAMPESTNDRPTSAVEYVFLLTKAERYFYDGEAVKCPATAGTDARLDQLSFDDQRGGPKDYARTGEGLSSSRKALVNLARRGGRAGERTRARRNSDWWFESWQGLYDEGDGPLAFVVNPAAFKEAHFATFPPKLVEPMVKAGTSEKGCCPTCGKPWERVVQKSGGTTGHSWHDHAHDAEQGMHQVDKQALKRAGGPYSADTLGWRPSCACYGLPIIEDQPAKTRGESDADYERRLADWWARWDELGPKYGVCGTRPCVVMDPFAGASTTGIVALQLGRRFVGIELSEEYVKMSIERLRKADAPQITVSDKEIDAPLFAESKEGSVV